MKNVLEALRNEIDLAQIRKGNFETIMAKQKTKNFEYWQRKIDNEQKLIDEFEKAIQILESIKGPDKYLFSSSPQTFFRKYKVVKK